MEHSPPVIFSGSLFLLPPTCVSDTTAQLIACLVESKIAARSIFLFILLDTFARGDILKNGRRK